MCNDKLHLWPFSQYHSLVKLNSAPNQIFFFQFPSPWMNPRIPGVVQSMGSGIAVGVRQSRVESEYRLDFNATGEYPLFSYNAIYDERTTTPPQEYIYAST